MNMQLIFGAEILAAVVLPLLVLYRRGGWRATVTVPCMVVLPLLWWFCNAFIHESSHLLCTYLVGGKVVDYQLIPRFWEGEYGKAWINSEALDAGRLLTTTVAPYVVDCVTLGGGLLVLRGAILAKPFVAGLLTMVLVLRPTYEFMSELTAFNTASGSDYAIIARLLGTAVTLGLACALIVCSWVSVILILRRFRAESAQHAEPGAVPNGGPATPLGNSGVTKGPPSVS